MAKLVGIREAAMFLGIESRAKGKREGNRLWELIRYRKVAIPHIRIGRRYLFDLQALDTWVKAQTRNSAAA